ncbi:hypothetical protein GCM10027615_30720 [Plantactinospora veratri]
MPAHPVFHAASDRLEAPEYRTKMIHFDIREVSDVRHLYDQAQVRLAGGKPAEAHGKT